MEEPTIGVEIEVEGAAQECLSRLPFIQLESHNDGSIRVPTYTIGPDEISVIPKTSKRGQITCSGMMQNRDYGYEGVSKPVPAAEMREKLGELSQFIGHVKGTARSSIHFHVDVANKPWRYVQNILLWGYHLEAVLFRLSCGGKHHRGETNDYRYCRPLSNPIAAAWGRTVSPLINWGLLSTAKTSSEFVYAWGRLDQYWIDGAPSLPHYVGHRLHMLNLASVLRQGTMEWRLFDPIYKNLPLALDIILAVHNLAEAAPAPDLPPLLLGTSPDITCKEVSDILGVDVSKLWGYRWASGVVDPDLQPHYGQVALSRTNRMQILNDTGEDTAPLYRRY